MDLSTEPMAWLHIVDDEGRPERVRARSRSSRRSNIYAGPTTWSTPKGPIPPSARWPGRSIRTQA